MGMIFLSENACAPLTEALENEGHDIYKVMASDVVYPAVSAHADIYMCLIGDTLLIDDVTKTEPSIERSFDLNECDIMSAASDDADSCDDPDGYFFVPAITTPDGAHRIVFNTGSIGYEYPDDVPYNAVVTDRFLIHNTELTSHEVLERARFAGLQIINVRQGYTRCSCLPVGSNAFITADEGIAKSLRAWNEMIRSEAASAVADGDDDEAASLMNDMIDILLIRQGYVHLEGFDHGFIGGTAGAVGKKIYFNGDLTEHPDSDIIVRFIEEHGYEPIWFADEPLTDIGSIFCI